MYEIKTQEVATELHYYKIGQTFKNVICHHNLLMDFHISRCSIAGVT